MNIYIDRKENHDGDDYEPGSQMDRELEIILQQKTDLNSGSKAVEAKEAKKVAQSKIRACMGPQSNMRSPPASAPTEACTEPGTPGLTQSTSFTKGLGIMMTMVGQAEGKRADAIASFINSKNSLAEETL